MSKFLKTNFLGYLLVGATGFLVDASLLVFISKQSGVSIYSARLTSFTSAVFITWLLNRGLIFRSKKNNLDQILFEFVKYLLTQSLGLIANLFVFFLLLRLIPALKMNIIIPLAFAAAIGLIINFFGSYLWVFKKKD